jgi:cytochrome c oxidase accessory protein FixG
LSSGGGSYFSKHQKVHPRIVHGRFSRLRIAALFLTLGVLYGLPWLRWGGRPAFLHDLPARKFYFFGLVFWPQDLIYLTAVLVVAALALFLFTALAGRVWCGYACPQTVFTQMLVWIERWVEGDRSSQIRLRKNGFSLPRTTKLVIKWTLWLAFAMFTSFSTLGSFVPIRELGGRILAGSLGPWESFFLVFIVVAILLFAGKMREQVCIYMCPYARFQSAMFDRNTLIVSYDAARGEPRGVRAKETAEKPLGDCVDCTLCVQACPTGIDIRNGLQYQCIACTACIDACDEVMDKVGTARGLVRYTTLNAIEHRKTRVLRPRVVVYALLMLGIATAVGISITNRVPVAFDVLRDRNAPYREARDGRIENVYRLKILNMDEKPRTYLLHATGLPNISVDYDAGDLDVGPGQVRDVPVRLRVAPGDIPEHSNSIELELVAADDEKIRVRESARFLGPRRRESEETEEPDEAHKGG